MPSASVIVSAYNNLTLFRKALRGYLRQSCLDFNLIIADDGSKPDLEEWLQQFTSESKTVGFETKHVWHEDLGFRKTIIINEAVRLSGDSPLLIFADGDCIPPSHFVAKHLAVHEAFSFHVGGVYRLSKEASEQISEHDINAGNYENLVTEKHRKDSRRRWLKSHWGSLFRLKNRPKMFGGNFGMDRQLYEHLNGYDERFTGWGLEDSDLRDRAMRLRPRPIVKNLYGSNDVFHLWHPENDSIKRRHLPTWAYYQQRRPVRCEMGLTSAELELES
ncbi:MAG: glycosyltransferase [Planctomycetes bacterium]|nr:glycosyltransferase [Planctomycetota bacterium]